MNTDLRKKFLFATLAAMAAVCVYLFLFDFQTIKRLIGYKASFPKTPATAELSFLSLPSDFSITGFASGLDGPRVIEFDFAGRMLVSETRAGRVMILEDADKDGKAEAKRVLLTGLNKPHGLAFYKNKKGAYLYVAETHQVTRYRYDMERGEVLDAVGENIANLPADGRHFTRTIAFGKNFVEKPDLPGKIGDATLSPVKLYISVGSSCDVCVENDWKRAAVLESDPEGNYTAKFASGLRNTVFFTFHPKTGEMWATEMGRDNLGDNLPPDEVNVVKLNKNYGWPYCYGSRMGDIEFKEPVPSGRIDVTSDCSKTEPSLINIPAHSAPLGIAFIPDNWPREWRGNLLIAYHGSRSGSAAAGYKIVRFVLDKNNRVVGIEDFISGWLEEGKIHGRPVDLKFGPDGVLYITDDAAGLIYKVLPFLSLTL